MTLFQQLRTHIEKLFVFFCVIAFLSFYHLHGLPSTTLYPVAGGDVGSPVIASLGPTSGQKHLVEVLVEEARRKYTHMVESQSKSLEEAIANYKKRYKREPPPGFADWYHVAVRLNATIIDNYDTVMTMFEPYWGISARELRARVREALDPRLVEGEMIGVRVKDHQFSTVNVKETRPNHFHFDILKNRMEPFLQFLPDMEYAFNAFDETRVFLPHDHATPILQPARVYRPGQYRTLRRKKIGSTSGGNYWDRDSSWEKNHQFRFVKDLNNGSKPISLLRQNSQSGFWEPYKATMKALSKYVHVGFTTRNHCADAVCKEMADPKEGVVFTKKEPIEASYGSKFAFDIDGHSYTERFQRLLQSHNIVFKMTIFQEWHDDFLVPWVHYVPVTLGMKELPETLIFFVETEKGQEIGKAITEDGRRWVQQAWRPADMKIAFFRILLEYGRLWGPERDKNG